MYATTLGATPHCLTRAQQEEAANLCGCVRSGGVVSVGQLGAGDASSSINIDWSASTQGPCKPTIPMPADFNPLDPCEASARPICPNPLERPEQSASSSSTAPTDYEEEIVSSATTNQRILVFGVLGLVVAGGGVLLYRALKKG